MAADRPLPHNLGAALAYAERGWAVLPVRAGSKVPLTAHGVKDASTNWEAIRTRWERWPSAAVAIATGSVSGIAVLDVDPRHGGDKSLAALEREHGVLPAGREARTPRGGRHLYFSLASGQVARCSAGKLGPGLDVRAGGGFVLAPPSLGYTWARAIEPAPLPDWLATLICAPAPKAKATSSPEAEKIREGQRNDSLTRLAGAMRRRGATQEAIEAALLSENAARCDPPLDEAEVRCIATSVSKYPSGEDSQSKSTDGDEEKDEHDAGSATGACRKPQAVELVDLVLAAGIELFHTPAMQAFATIPAGNHRETWPLKSVGFRSWLSYRFYKETAKTPNPQALQSALSTLTGRALFEGKELPVFVRVAEKEGSIYLDLADPEWRAVEISKDGWHAISDPPVRFRRPRGMLPLPAPVPGGDVQEIFRFANIKERADQILFLAHAVASLRPTGPYPILALHGGQGSAKTTTGTVERQLIDPNEALLRTTPRDERDLAITASNSYLIGLDNISWVPYWLSDALCRIATGGGLATRELYTDDEEVIFQVKRPVVLNGIEELSARGDLLDRMIIIHLAPPQEYRDEKKFWADFEAARPSILGALLDGVSAALRNVGKVQLPSLPRMADFAVWATAAEEALGFQHGEFIRAYTTNRAEANRVALESSPVGLEIIAFLDSCGGAWEGTAGDLLRELTDRADELTRKERHWPKSGKGMRDALDRVAPNLAAVGISIIKLPREGRAGRRVLRIEKSEPPSETSATSAGQSPQSPTADSAADGAGPTVSESSADTPFALNVSGTTDGSDVGLHPPAYGPDEAVEGEF